MKKLEIGDRVAYSVQFLASIGASHSDMASGRGTITGLVPLGSTTTLAEIDWNGQELPPKVNVANLAKVGLNTRFSNC
jgi:hypothetical protein